MPLIRSAQVAALALASANGLLLKSGKEADHSNLVLYELVKQAVQTELPPDVVPITLVQRPTETLERQFVSEVLQLQGKVDLVIPRGSNQMVQSIQAQAKGVPVLGHADGVCHVYLHEAADMEKAVRVVRDAKCDYPSACNAMETLLLDEKIWDGPVAEAVLDALQKEGVKFHWGPRLAALKGEESTIQLHCEYGDLECAVEVCVCVCVCCYAIGPLVQRPSPPGSWRCQ